MKIDQTSEVEERMAAYEAELRDKYTQADRDRMAKSGEAMPDGAYPIADAEDLENAISTVGLGNASDKSIRAHIVKRAKALGLEAKLPEAWNADGSKSEAKSDVADVEERAKCPTCKGTGTILDGNRDCPDCDGTGTVDGDTTDDASRSATPNVRKRSRHRAVPLMPEVRFWHAEGIEYREKSNTNELWISGMPVVYDTPYTVTDALGSFSERMAPGVANDVLAAGCDTRLLYNHDGLSLARTRNDRGLPPTMTLADSPEGLRFEACLDLRQQLANDVAISLERGDSSQMSVGFRVGKDEWSDGWDERTIHSFDSLLDVSIVSFPASESTTVDIMRRYAEMVPVESAARIRKMYIDTRAGAKMSSQTQKMLADAFMGLHSALSDAGAHLPSVSPMDPDGSIGQDGDAGNGPDSRGETNADALTPVDGVESTVTEVGNVDDVQDLGDDPSGLQSVVFGDGSQGGATMGGDGYPGYADGSGLRAAPATKEERATASMSFGDQESLIYAALVAKFEANPWIECDLWIRDASDDWVVFESWGDPCGLWKVSYTLTDGVVTFADDCAQVAAQTSFVPVGEPAASVPVVQGRSVRDLRLALEARKRRRVA
jgi:HK97 family phage prohead protease